MVDRWKKRLAFGLALLASGCSTAPGNVPAEAPRPALWKVADADTTIYLFGTIHMLPEGVKWRSPALDEAIKASDGLVIETLIGDDPMASAGTMMKLGLSKGLPPLVERVPADKRPQLEALIKSAGVPAGSLDGMETWAAGLTLLAVSFQKMGFDPALGVEVKLAGDYKGKKIEGLETVEQQFGFFDGLSEDAQRQFLVGILDTPAAGKAEFEKMLSAWSKGDVAQIAKTFDSETALSPELREVLMKKRNAAWSQWLAKRLETPGTVMVAVGAGHLAGRDSVQAMLKARGLKATRVQ